MNFAIANIEIKLCKAQAIPISMYHSLPVGIPNMAQKPRIRIPKISSAATLSAAVGPKAIRRKQNPPLKSMIIKTLCRSFDCQPISVGKGQNKISANTANIKPNPKNQRKRFKRISSAIPSQIFPRSIPWPCLFQGTPHSSNAHIEIRRLCQYRRSSSRGPGSRY